jgi:hypothetical protein
MKKFFDIFNHLFFGGLLSSCKLQLTEARLEHLGEVKGFCELKYPGLETDPRFKLEYLASIICIRKPGDDLFTVGKGAFVIIQELLNTLLHEQLHAVFQLHTCYCDAGCQEKLDYDNDPGHGVEWLAAALIIERAATHLFGWPVNMGRETSLVHDIHFLGYRMPNEVMMRVLDLDLPYILDLLSWCRVETEKRGKEKRERLPFKKNICLRDIWTVDSWEKGFQGDEWLLK